MTIVSLMMLLLPLGASEPPLATPPLPPGVVCGDRPVLELADLPLTAETTFAEVRAAWGEPRSEGPAGEVALYFLTCDARLWLTFEPSGQRRLMRAVLLTGGFVPETRVILDRLVTPRFRQCRQLPLGRRIVGTRVVRAWGPPDNEIGSGIVRWTYKMADGGDAQVFPHGRFVTVSCRRGKR